MLSELPTNIVKDKITRQDGKNSDSLSKFSASIFDQCKQSNSDHGDHIDHMVDYSLLDQNVMSALNGGEANKTAIIAMMTQLTVRITVMIQIKWRLTLILE